MGERLRKILDGRRLVSVTFLDGLEHLTDGTHVLVALGELLAEHRALAVTSVPNVTHLDVGIKTLLGSWDYTEAGLLDVTHVQLFSEQSLTATLRSAGLRRIGREDVLLARSDQHFPGNHVGISEATMFSSYLRGVRGDAEPHGLVNQFVWALTAAPAQPAPRFVDPASTESDRFLSVVMRTQGRRCRSCARHSCASAPSPARTSRCWSWPTAPTSPSRRPSRPSSTTSPRRCASGSASCCSTAASDRPRSTRASRPRPGATSRSSTTTTW